MSAPSIIASVIAGGAVGGIGARLIDWAALRRRTKAETDRTGAEAEKVAAEARKVEADTRKVEADTEATCVENADHILTMMKGELDRLVKKVETLEQQTAACERDRRNDRAEIDRLGFENRRLTERVAELERDHHLTTGDGR